MSPEQTGRMDRPIDWRTDLYSLGVTYYQMLTGQLPFEAKDALAWMHCHMAQPPRPLRRAEGVTEVPEVLSAILMKLLSKAPEDRYQSASGLAADLEECQRKWQREGRIESF